MRLLAASSISATSGTAEARVCFGTMHKKRETRQHRYFGICYAWLGFAVMWGFWVSFVIFLATPRQLASVWPLPMVDRGGLVNPGLLTAALIDFSLIALFAVQHSAMARPWFKRRVLHNMPPAFQRCTYVHLANAALF